jgi:K+-transporting ATPase c subunit
VPRLGILHILVQYNRPNNISNDNNNNKNDKNNNNNNTHLENQNTKTISNWRRKLSILTESGSGLDTKLNIKKRKIFQKYKVTSAIEIAQLIEELKQKEQAKARRMRRYEKRRNQCIQNKMFNVLGAETTATTDQPHM